MLASLATVLLVFTTFGDGYRLPKDVVPTQYNLKVVTELGSKGLFYFFGEVCIQVMCKKDTDTIILHADKTLNLIEKKITITHSASADNLLMTIERVPEKQLLRLKLKTVLIQGNKYTIHIPFSAEIKKQLVGYYLASYKDKASKQTRWLAVTHLQPSGARLVFPCFDEPEFKARFLVSLGRHKKYRTLSNMPQSHIEPIIGMRHWEWDHYLNSVPMSTYILAFMVSDYQYVTSPANPQLSNVTFRIWARPDALKQAKFASEIGPRVLKFYEKFFDISFPLPKLDMVAIPDFAFGAMENWGLVTYRERALLVDPREESTPVIERVVNTIAHELAHQWFGNLVTMKWWNEVWLNEGFATFVSQLGEHAILPQWNTMDYQAVTTVGRVLEADSLQSSHPMSVNFKSEAEIGQIFDSISYSKGCLMLRMMTKFLGEDVFRNGVINYLKKFMYGSAEQDDLWSSLTTEAHRTEVLPSNMTVKSIMDTWTLQTGYPLIMVERDYQKGTAKITQRRYLSYVSNNSSQENSCWSIPLTYTSEGSEDFEDTTPDIWMDCTRKEVTISGLPNDGWTIFNIQYADAIRVNYDKENWQMIESTLNSDEFSSIGLLNRVQLIEDAFGLARVGLLDYEEVLRLVKYLPNETEYLPWNVAMLDIEDIGSLIGGTDSAQKLEDYMRTLAQSKFKVIKDLVKGLQSQDLQEVLMQRLLLSLACRFNLGDCMDFVRNVYFIWSSQPNPDLMNPIPADMRDVVYCNSVNDGNENVWNFLWARYLNSNVPGDKTLMLKALVCTKDKNILRRLLEYTLDEDHGIRKQDSWVLFGHIASSREGFAVAKEFLYKKISVIYNNFAKSESGYVAKYLKPIAQNMVTESELQEKFINDHAKIFEMASMATKQSMEQIESNILWRKERLPGFAAALNSVL